MDKVVHFEIPADDVKRAQKFYSEAFGWQMHHMPAMDYTLVTTTPSTEKGPKEPGAINGGMCKRTAPLTNPVIVLNVDDIDIAIKKVEKSGGKIVRPKSKVGEMGLVAYFKDTEQNVVGLWQGLGGKP